MFLKCFGESSSSGRPYPTVIEELCRHFSLADIRKSTNNFDDNRVIGEEGWTKVYKGCLQHIDGSDYAVAVKRFIPGEQSTPEYLRNSTVTDKCDVYAFGGVLLEVVCGSLFFLKQNEVPEKCVEENFDPKIKGDIAPECWQVFIDIALRCIKNEADERPAMGEVEVELELALLLQQQADVKNIDSDYTLLSKTVIIPTSGGGFDYVIGQFKEQETEYSDSEDMFNR